MGLMDTAKLMQKAMQAKKKMSLIQGVGTSGSIKGVVFDGLYTTTATQADREYIKTKLAKYNLGDAAIEDIAKMIEKDVKDANNDAKKHLEKQMAENTSLDDIKSMFN
jgi:hypothetical protein